MNDEKLFGVKLQISAEKLLECYQNCFEAVFGGQPVLDNLESMEICRWAVNTLGYEKALVLIQGYFRYDNDWVRQQAYPLKLFKSKINEVIASCSTGGTLERPKFIVAISESGYPVASHNMHTMNGYFRYNPVPYDEWFKQSIKDKLQFSREWWESAGNDVGKWIELWKESGFLPNDGLNLDNKYTD